MILRVASVYRDDDPDSSRRYVHWTRHTLYSDGSVTLESGTEDSDWGSYSATANEVNPPKELKWADLSSDIQEALKEDAARENKLPDFELATSKAVKNGTRNPLQVLDDENVRS